MRFKGDVPQHYFVTRGPYGGPATYQGDDHLLRVMSEDEDGNGWGVRMVATIIAGPFPTEKRAREVLSSIIMSCPEYHTDEKRLPKWKMPQSDIKKTRRKMGLK